MTMFVSLCVEVDRREEEGRTDGLRRGPQNNDDMRGGALTIFRPGPAPHVNKRHESVYCVVLGFGL